MRKHLLLWVAAVIVLAPMLAAAADLSGTWKAEFTTPDGQQRVNTFVLKVEGGKVTGTVKGMQDETPIQNGKVDGNEISFTAERPFGTVVYKGKASGDTIQFNMEVGGQSLEITAKRISPKQ
jgi:hypothetical protein